MKTIIFALGLLLIPNASFASPITVGQANSLISVVQSSTTTPASAFVPLITSFSSITVAQAESLINVVQKAPEVPASAFVNMLLAFTVDPIQTPTPIVQTTASPVLGSVQTTQTTQATTTIVQIIPDYKLEVLKNGMDKIGDLLDSDTTKQLGFMVNVRDINTNEYLKQQVTVTTDDPDLPSSFVINAQGQVQYFCVAPTYDGFPNNGCKNDRPVTIGTFNFTFSVGNVSKSVKVTIK